MIEFRLQPLTALGGTEPRIDTIGDLQIIERDDVALASLAARRGRASDVAATAETLLGAPLPGPNQAVLTEPVSAFWTAPDQWMLMAPYGTHELLADQIKSEFADSASVSEQSDGWVVFDVTGPSVNAVLERLTPVDVHGMKAGFATRTRFDHLGGFLICRFAGLTVTLLSARSSAGSLHHALTEAARSVAALSPTN